MPGYNWPSKIRRYKITDPCQRFLVVKYESVIDWNGDQITSPESLDRHIREKMIPKLKARITPETQESHYCRTINLDHMIQNPAPHIDEARKIRDQKGDEAARKFLLDHINTHKLEAFSAWWNYLTKENPVYAASAAFQYLLLRPVVDSSDAKCTRSPVNPDAEALAHVHEGIQNDTLAPTEKLLKVLCEFMAFGKRQGNNLPAFGTACGWVFITNRMDKAAGRVAALAQGSGWCVASPSMASNYLCSSDFHLLVENGRAVAAIRTKKGKAVEIQGKGNQDPGNWWPRILLYCSARAFVIDQYARKLSADAASLEYRTTVAAKDDLKQLSAHLKEHPAQVQFVTDEVANDENYRLAIETAWLACVKADPMCSALAPQWMARDGEMEKMVIEGWKDILGVDPSLAVRIPVWIKKQPGMRDVLNQVLANEWPAFWARKKAGVGPYKTIRFWKGIPKRLHTHPALLQQHEDNWRNYCSRHPAQAMRCPAEIIEKKEVFAAVRDSVGRYITTSKHRADYLMQQWKLALKGRTPFHFLQLCQHVKGVLDDLGRDIRTSALPPVLMPVPEVAVSKADWISLLQRFPAEWARCPAEFRVDPDIVTARTRGWIQHFGPSGNSV